MPTNKDFKRVVRDRMKKTGESYTAARAQLVHNKPAPKRRPRAERALGAASTADYAKIAGMSDASVKKATGCTWERWVIALDYAEAEAWTHQQITEYVQKKFNVPDWWTQMVTVGYERIKGLRARGQRRDGTYEVSKSKVLPVPLTELFASFDDSKRRKRWMTGVEPEVRHTSPNKSMRLRWPDGSAVDIGFFDKGGSKSQVAIGHRKLPSAADATRMKAFWSEKLQALAELLR
ncbi:MAG TPA: hypothetical protein VH080_09340 [Gemmatimonadaceae bacterium]|jgi:hypothetical protein|nr:hypothetical protein [Gemmatimonadaceae bacterium]